MKPTKQQFSLAWQRVDIASLEIARVADSPSGHQISGTVILVHDDRPHEIRYAIATDELWLTRRVIVDAVSDAEPITIALITDGQGNWQLDDQTFPTLDGCLDVDLGFSPVTNTLPIRRLSPSIGERVDLRAAWIRFPDLAVEVLEQSYERVGERSYHYRSATGFERVIEVDESGFVVNYPGIWTAVPKKTT